MTIEAQIERLAAAIETLAGAVMANTSVAGRTVSNVVAATAEAAPAPAPAAEDKPKRGRPAKTAPVVEAAPAPVEEAPAEPQAEEDPFGAEDAAAATPALTLDDVRTAGLAYRDKHGQEKAKELVKKFGAEKLADMPEKNWAAFIAATKTTAGSDADL